MRIVLIEDNQGLARGIAYRLQDLGHAVDVISDGLAADEFLRSGGGDLVILDINLPRLDGVSLVRAMRARGDGRPVLLLTARAETHDRVAGLDAGADDYLVKPFDMAELEARLRALTRRRAQDPRPSRSLGTLTLDLDGRQVAVSGKPLDLPRREIAVLESLLLAEGRTVAKPDLLEHVYGTGADIEESAIEVHVSRLRKRLKPHGLSIRARRGLGYAILLEEQAATP